MERICGRSPKASCAASGPPTEANCNTEYKNRIRKINDVLDDCGLLLDYIQICLEEKIIDIKTSAAWTQKVTDVKYMAAAWKKKTQELARKPEAERRAAEDARLRRL